MLAGNSLQGKALRMLEQPLSYPASPANRKGSDGVGLFRRTAVGALSGVEQATACLQALDRPACKQEGVLW